MCKTILYIYVNGRNKQKKKKEKTFFPIIILGISNNFEGIMQVHRSKNPQMAHAAEMIISEVNQIDQNNIRHKRGDSLYSKESKKEGKFLARNYKEHLEILNGKKTKHNKTVNLEFHSY